MKENQKLLYRQSIDAPKYINQEAVRGLYMQKPNRKILGLPIAPLVSIYYFGFKRYDQEKYIRRKEAYEKKYDAKIAAENSQKKINKYLFKKQNKVDKMNSYIENGNLLMQWGEPISIFDTAAVRITKEKMRSYLFTNGYFQGTVTSKITPHPQQVRVKYILNPGKAYFIDSIFYDVQDTAIFRIINDHVDRSYIKKGTRYEQDNLTKERERIDLLLKDFGYYEFSRQYIEYKTDTTFEHPDRRLAIIISINEPEKRGFHKKFAIDTVNFTTDVGTTVPNQERTMKSYRDIRYRYYHPNYNLKILNQRVFIRPEQIYSRSKTLNTQKQLGNVDVFKFVNINYDTSDGKFIANIFASPLAKNEWTNEAGMNVTQGFPGPFYSISYKRRNVFHGMETFDLTGRYGFEGVASATSSQNIYKSTSAGVNAALTFPQFIWFFKERRRIKFAEYNPKTRLAVGYTYNERPEYRRSLTSLSGVYTWQNSHKTTFSFTPINFSSIAASNLSLAFRDLLDKQKLIGNNALIYSFRPSFVNSIIFGVTWNLKEYGSLEHNSSYIRAQVESGGTIWNLIDPKFLTDRGLQYYKYIRLSVDLRRVSPIDKNTILAYRFNSGFAYSYSANRSLPYEKFFFAGGSNSIRAWRPRRLGPGSAPPGFSPNPRGDGLFNYSIEKPSEILIEGSVELRQKLFGFVNGAVFVDAGNVWNFRPQNIEKSDGSITQDDRGQFNINRFYKQFGVGTGFGLRFDFSFIILRFDVGMKVYDPARDRGDKFVLDKVRFWKPYAKEADDGTFTNYKEPVIYNVGIGFPF
ncbi:MAG: BamA/TamA family outer membrane protein [Chryseolinea sp.]